MSPILVVAGFLNSHFKMQGNMLFGITPVTFIHFLLGEFKNHVFSTSNSPVFFLNKVGQFLQNFDFQEFFLPYIANFSVLLM